jgi:hypothetical protein
MTATSEAAKALNDAIRRARGHTVEVTPPPDAGEASPSPPPATPDPAPTSGDWLRAALLKAKGYADA